MNAEFIQATARRQHAAGANATIHYRGTLADTNEIGAFVEELIDIAETMKWPYSVFEDDWSKPVTAAIEVSEGRADITGNLGGRPAMKRCSSKKEPI